MDTPGTASKPSSPAVKARSWNSRPAVGSTLLPGDKDPNIEWAVIKSIAGLMNASGGTLLVGVTDAGEIRGIEPDYPLLRKPDTDGWDLWLTDLLTTALGRAAAAEGELTFCQMHDVVARIDVEPAPSPVFARKPKGDGKECYMVRINSSTQELSGSELLEHQQRRWRH
jgi:predicted HTH transcriptional regulator